MSIPAEREATETQKLSSQKTTVVHVDQDEASDVSSVSSLSGTTLSTKKSAPAVASEELVDGYESPPLVKQSTILMVGVALFGMALLWPPLILFVAYLVSILVPYSFRENDSGEKRRQLFHEFIRNAPPELKRVGPGVKLEERYWVNQRGMCLCTSIMTPKLVKTKAVVCFLHGYTDHSSYNKRLEYQRLVEKGIAVILMDYPGHGRSDGTNGLVEDWDLLIDDCVDYFSETIASRFPDVKAFLMGESMGGAVAYCVYKRAPELFAGVVFVSPMCKISDDMLPPQWVIDVVKKITGKKGATSFFGILPIAPSRGDLRKFSYHLPEKRKNAVMCPTTFGRNPRLVTARELLDVTAHLSQDLANFDAPFLVMHGKDDRVTDPRLSQALYDESKSTDKTIRLYEDMWHCITGGETDEKIDLVFNDTIEWILKRS